MKMVPILGLGGVPVVSDATGDKQNERGALQAFEGHGGILSAALAMPDAEHDRRHRMLERYLEKRAGFIHAGNDTIH